MNELQYKQALVDSCLEIYHALDGAIKSSAPYDVADKKNFYGPSQTHTFPVAWLAIAEAYQAQLLQFSELPPGPMVENKL